MVQKYLKRVQMGPTPITYIDLSPMKEVGYEYDVLLKSLNNHGKNKENDEKTEKNQ